MFNIPVVDDTQVVSKNRRSGIMLCYPFEEKRLSSWKSPYVIQPKLDGVRCRAMITRDGVKLISSENHFIDLVPHINEELWRMFKRIAGDGYVELDGELYTHGMDFSSIISITSRSKNLHTDSGKIQYHVFDVVGSENQAKRLTILTGMFNTAKSDIVKVVPYWLARGMEDVMIAYHNFLDDGYEGFIIRDAFGKYERKRYTGIMKFKPHQKDDYVIAGYSTEVDMFGSEKTGMLGRFICMTDPDLPVLGNYPAAVKPPDGYFGVGTGLTQDQKYAYWEQREALVGSKLKVKYQSLFTGSNVPRFPVVLKVKSGL